MTLSVGSRIGHYDIVGTLGAGGMGEVYRARDTRLDREVALKILPQAFAADPERLRRFEREAKTLASLNHPSIAQIYGIEDVAGGSHARALVMELVPGRTLAELLEAGGGLGAPAAISIASQIADALEAAHEAGIVHRDLKPANVKVRDDDVVKVLDFGLARGAGAGEATGGASDPTMLSPAATQQGVILGTASYMSPEQARGRVADKRADIWAFGVVLYEMLTGTRLFDGESVGEITASVIKDAPRLDALPADTPPVLRQLLLRCLERDPKLRLRDIGEARVMLANPSKWAADPNHGSPARSRSVLRTVALFGGVLALTAAAGLLAWNLKPDASASTIPVRRFTLPAAMANGELAISRDGRRIAYLANMRLHVYELRTGRSADLGPIPPATAGLFFSPDGQRIAYGAETTLRVVPIQGGPHFIVCNVPTTGRVEAGLWLDDGTIYFAVWRDSLYRVAATGGTPAIHAAIDASKEIDFHSVDSLPGNRLLVVTHLREQDGTRADVINAGVRTPLADDLDIRGALFVSPDRLVFSRTRTNIGVWTVPFGNGKVDLAKAVLVEPEAKSFVVSDEGTLVSSIDAREQRELVWVKPDAGTTPNRSVSTTETIRGTPFESLSSIVALSLDGRRGVLTTRASGGKHELLVRDLATGTDTRVPMPQPSTGMQTGARVTWTPAGRLLYAAGGVETLQVYDWPADGSSNGRPLVAGMTAKMRHDGQEVLFIRDERRLRLYRAPILANGTAGKAELVFAGADEPSVRWFDISADGTLLAFTITDATTSQLNIFVATYPDLRERRQVTSNGGTQPHFSRDGRQLYFMSPTRRPDSGIASGALSVVTLTTKPLTASAPRTLMVDSAALSGSPTLSGFDVAADGRLLMTRVAPTAPGEQARTVLLQNWIGSIGK